VLLECFCKKPTRQSANLVVLDTIRAGEGVRVVKLVEQASILTMSRKYLKHFVRIVTEVSIATHLAPRYVTFVYRGKISNQPEPNLNLNA